MKPIRRQTSKALSQHKDNIRGSLKPQRKAYEISRSFCNTDIGHLSEVSSTVCGEEWSSKNDFDPFDLYINVEELKSNKKLAMSDDAYECIREDDYLEEARFLGSLSSKLSLLLSTDVAPLMAVTKKFQKMFLELEASKEQSAKWKQNFYFMKRKFERVCAEMRRQKDEKHRVKLNKLKVINSRSKNSINECIKNTNAPKEYCLPPENGKSSTNYSTNTLNIRTVQDVRFSVTRKEEPTKCKVRSNSNYINITYNRDDDCIRNNFTKNSKEYKSNNYIKDNLASKALKHRRNTSNDAGIKVLPSETNYQYSTTPLYNHIIHLEREMNKWKRCGQQLMMQLDNQKLCHTMEVKKLQAQQISEKQEDSQQKNILQYIISELKSHISFQETEIKNGNVQLLKYMKISNDIGEKLYKCQRDCIDRDNKIRELSTLVSEKENIILSLREQLKIETASNEKHNEFDSLTQRIDKLEVYCKLLDKERSGFLKQCEMLQTEKEDLISHIKELSSRISDDELADREIEEELNREELQAHNEEFDSDDNENNEVADLFKRFLGSSKDIWETTNEVCIDVGSKYSDKTLINECCEQIQSTKECECTKNSNKTIENIKAFDLKSFEKGSSNSSSKDSLVELLNSACDKENSFDRGDMNDDVYRKNCDVDKVDQDVEQRCDGDKLCGVGQRYFVDQRCDIGQRCDVDQRCDIGQRCDEDQICEVDQKFQVDQKRQVGEKYQVGQKCQVGPKCAIDQKCDVDKKCDIDQKCVFDPNQSYVHKNFGTFSQPPAIQSHSNKHKDEEPSTSEQSISTEVSAVTEQDASEFVRESMTAILDLENSNSDEATLGKEAILEEVITKLNLAKSDSDIIKFAQDYIENVAVKNFVGVRHKTVFSCGNGTCSNKENSGVNAKASEKKTKHLKKGKFSN